VPQPKKAMSKVGRNDPCPCGSGKKYKQCHLPLEGPTAARMPQAVAGPDVGALLMSAFGEYQQNRLDAAEALVRRVQGLSPGNPDAPHLLGLLAQARGRLDEALALMDEALRRGGAGNHSVHGNRGLVLRSMGRLADAVAAMRTSLSLNPRDAAVWCNLGSVLQATGPETEAEAAFRSAIAADPRFAPGHAGLGMSLSAMGRSDEAEEALGRALELDPSSAEAHMALGQRRQSQHRVGDALQHYRRARELAGRKVFLLDAVGGLLVGMNELDEARLCFAAALAVEPTTERRIQLGLMLPAIADSAEALVQARRDFEAAIDDIDAHALPVSVVGPGLFAGPMFYLAYHGVDVRPLMEKVARMYERLHPGLLFEAAHVASRRDGSTPIRIGFVTRFINNHPVTHCFQGLIESMSLDARFDVALISLQDFAVTETAGTYRAYRGRKVPLPRYHADARSTIAALELDLLVYLDIGMDDLTYFLAFARLARVQCVLGGHPVTTGIRHLDYFVSSALAEPVDGPDHYSERLALLPFAAVSYQPPTVPEPFRTREQLGLPAEGRLYLCPMMLQKIHPDFDAAIAAILERDPEGHVVFFAHQWQPWREALDQRFAHTVPAAVRGRVHFMPFLVDKADFLSANAHAAVVLDPFHFGIGSTATFVFAVGTPLVTLPAPYMRGRAGLFYARLLETPECVATDVADYIDRAVRIATDETLRESVKERILVNRHRLFVHPGIVEDLAALFIDMLRAGPPHLRSQR